MKKTVIAMLVLMLLNLGVSQAWAEISQDLDPMIPVDPQTMVTEEAPGKSIATGEASHEVSADPAKKDEMKKEKSKKKKAKKNSSKKSSKKNSTSNCKNSKTSKHSSH